LHNLAAGQQFSAHPQSACLGPHPLVHLELHL
jgi:hypothetical protein